jgi:hypothetical protein
MVVSEQMINIIGIAIIDAIVTNTIFLSTPENNPPGNSANFKSTCNINPP